MSIEKFEFVDKNSTRSTKINFVVFFSVLWYDKKAKYPSKVVLKG